MPSLRVASHRIAPPSIKADYKMEILHSLRHAVQGRRDYIAFIPMVWLCLLTAELNGYLPVS